MTMNEPAFVPPYLTLKEAAEYLERATGKAWNPSMLMGFCAQQNIPVNAAVPRDARAVQCEVTNYVPELTIRPVKLPPLTIKGRTHAHYWLATWRMAVVYPGTIARVWQTGRGEVAHGVPTARDHEPCMVLFVNDKHEPVTHEVTAEDLRVQRDTLRVIQDRWSETQALPAARPATPAPSASAPAAALPEPVAAHAEAVAPPSASASPAARPEAVAAPAAPGAPDSASAPTVAPPEAVPDGKPEAAEARQDRRLLELRSMGADFVPHGEGWRVTWKRGALAELVKREAGRPMGTRDGVRKDLQKAVQREMKQRESIPMNGRR